ncbi:hypothetical protein OC846_000344 [Tilletia horrida]|uniref:C2H2-type domain-containing protein n=1 Tax=Tilletia horrida TaxID=155126 RepID=A0AAN6H0W0_9BASI|nr:hypothetical protein OC846_000344 [Tilletia horrida]
MSFADTLGLLHSSSDIIQEIMDSLFPPIQSGITAQPPATSTATTNNGMQKEIVDWTSLFSQSSSTSQPAPTAAASDSINFNPNMFVAGSPEGISVGSPASSRDFGSPLLDFELPFGSENEAALFPPERPSDVADWMAKFNLFSAAASPSAMTVENQPLFSAPQTNSAPLQTSIQPASQIDIASFLRTAALLTAQQHSSSQQSTAAEALSSQSSAINMINFSQQQDRAIADALANSTVDLAASQQSLVSQASTEDDFMPIQAPVNFQHTSWNNQVANAGAQNLISSCHTNGSQLSSRGGSPNPPASQDFGVGAVNTLANVFVREYARNRPVHEINNLVQSLSQAGINISDEVLREIVGLSPLTSPTVRPSTAQSATTMSAVNSNPSFAMLMSGLGMSAPTRHDADSRYSLSQSSSVSSLSSLPNVSDATAQQSQQVFSQHSAMSQSQSDDGWSSDASWTPNAGQSVDANRKVKVSSVQTPARARSSVSSMHSGARNNLLGNTGRSGGNSHPVEGTVSADGAMTTVYLPSGKRAFSCNVCHKLFDRAFNLRTHADTHKSVEEREKGKRFICPFQHGQSDECGKPFARKHDCIRHWKTVHGRSIAGTNSPTVINKLKVPAPIMKEPNGSESSSDGDIHDADDDESDDDLHSHQGSEAHFEVSASTGRNSFG